MERDWLHSALAVKGVACQRGGRLVYADLSFELKSGNMLVLRGANGCGKSSLLRQIAGLLPLAGGEISFAGDDSLKDNLSYVAHQTALKSYLTVRENLSFWAQLLDGHVRVDEAAEFWGLSRLLDLPGAVLSQGQRQRVALARLLLAPRPLWLLDEPQTGLDAKNQARLEAAIANHLDAGGMAIIASHLALATETSTIFDFDSVVKQMDEVMA